MSTATTQSQVKLEFDDQKLLDDLNSKMSPSEFLTPPVYFRLCSAAQEYLRDILLEVKYGGFKSAQQIYQQYKLVLDLITQIEGKVPSGPVRPYGVELMNPRKVEELISKYELKTRKQK
jgi:hypothetical protein